MFHRLMTLAAISAVTTVVGCASDGGPAKPAAEASSQPAAADRATALDAGALRAALSDKTHEGVMMGKNFRAYFAPDGSVEANVEGDVLKGNWSQDGDTFCIDWVTPPIPRGCSWIALDTADSGITYKADDNTLRNTVKILPGRQL